MLVVEQVPCLECDDCGEQYFEIAVLKRIEADHRDIAKHRKQANNPVGAGCRAEVRVAGTVMRESEFSHRAAQESLPLRDAFSVLFFVSVGMLFDPTIPDFPRTNTHVVIGHFRGDDDWISPWHCPDGRGPTHWMPLPPGPETA